MTQSSMGCGMGALFFVAGDARRGRSLPQQKTGEKKRGWRLRLRGTHRQPVRPRGGILMAPLSIPGLPQAGNLSSPLWTVPGLWPSSGGLRRRCRVRSGRASRAASTPSRAWATPCLSPRVPHAVLTPSALLLRPPVLTHCAAPLARRHAVRGLHGRGTSAGERKEVTMIQRG
jgi:hypothetical protein